jgi:hypothetical protein
VLLATSPTATHALTVLQDTLVNEPAAGVGVLSSDHVVPFHRSTTSPTAVQAVLDVHDTPPSWAELTPVGLVSCWIFQLVPFQRSTNATKSLVLLVSYPTAVQAFAEVHDTPNKTASPAGSAAGGLGVS